MPGKVKVKILAGRNLPVMDRGSDTTDAYVEIKLASVVHKTDVCRKSLNPTWNSDWYRFEVDDAELQDEPLQIRLMDYDTYSANDAIGKVYISLNPLLHPALDTQASNHISVMSGWIPVYDTMNGVRGEVNLIVKVDLFSDVNKFRQSSCGVKFFHSPIIPHGYHAQIIHGFVEELVVNDDPEYQWIDKIRTPRASNEARQIAFIKLSGQVQRKIGLKAIDMGANAVLGYIQCFDLEGDVGVVARGIGTAVTLIKLNDNSQSGPHDNTLIEENELTASPNQNSSNGRQINHYRTESISRHSPAKVGTPGSAIVNLGRDYANAGICRRSSDSDISITPKGNSLNSGEKTTTAIIRTGILVKPHINHETLDMLEYPFLTIAKFPPGFIIHLGATVTARSVKLLERVPNPDEPETRDSWWNELRMEIRSHARAICCNVVLGYTEQTTISDDVCVLTAYGTAALINLQYTGEITALDSISNSHKNQDEVMNGVKDLKLSSKSNENGSVKISDLPEPETAPTATTNGTKEPVTVTNASYANINCSVCHVPYGNGSAPFRTNTIKCSVCKRGRVPDVLLATIEMPDGLQVTGRGCLLQAHICRPKRDLRSELNAKEISDSLPFLEYELHKLLISKLKMKGMNAIFGLKTSVAIGERMLALLATGTAVYLTALPPPLVPTIVPGNQWSDTEKLQELQKSIQVAVEKNREIYQLKTLQEYEMSNKNPNEDTDDSDDDMADLDLTAGNKEACVLEIDDLQDLELISMLHEPSPPEGFHVVNTQLIPGLYDMEIVRNLQMFTQVWRAKIPATQPNIAFAKHFQRLLQTIYFKLRSMIPCAICDLKFRLDLPETDDIQLLVTGMALGLGEPNKINRIKRKTAIIHNSRETAKKNDEDLIFNLEEDQGADNGTAIPSLLQTGSLKSRKRSPPRVRLGSLRLPRHVPLRERYGVDITPLSYVPGGKIDKYLGNLNFFFIRESTSVRENGGISGFVHGFITEVLAVIRAHVTALGGNAMVAFYMTELNLVDNMHKNQGQCLVSVGGDVVFVSYFNED